MAIDIVLRVDEKKGVVAVENFGRRSRAALRRTEKAGTKSMNRMATNGTRALKTLAGAFAGVFAARALVRGFRSAIDATADFQKGIAEIKTLGVQKSLKEIGSEVDALSREFGQESQQTIKAYYDAISAGVKEANIGQFMREASRLAIAGATDISTATDLLTTLGNVFRDETTRSLAAYANEAKNLGKITIPELSQNLGTVAATAKTAGASAQELMAAIVALTKQGIVAETAMTGLRAMFSNIVTPARQVEAAAKGAGLEFSITALRTKGLAQFLTELVPKLEGNDKLITQLFGNVRAFNAVAAIAGEKAEAFGEALEKIEGEAALANLEAGFRTMQETAAFTFAQMREELESTRRQLADELLPAVVSFAKGLKDIFELIRGDVYERGLVAPLQRAGGEYRKLAEELANTEPFETHGRHVVDNSRKIQEMKDRMAELDLQAKRTVLEKFPEMADEVMALSATLRESGVPMIDSYNQAITQLSLQRKSEAEAIRAGNEAIEAEETARTRAAAAAEEQAEALRKLLEKVGKLPVGEGWEDFFPGVEALQRVRQGIADAKAEIVDLGTAFEMAETPAEEGLLARQILAGLEPELIGPQVAERLRAIFEEMDPEELRENIPSLIDLMRSEEPAEDAKKIVENLTEPIDLGLEGLQMRFQGAANVFGQMVALFGKSTAAGAAFARAQAIWQGISAIISGKLAVTEGALKIAASIAPPDPPLAASGLAMKIAGVTRIAAGVASIAQAAGIGKAERGGLFEQPAVSTFAERGPELALPLEDDRTTAALAGAFEKAFGEEGGRGETHLHFHGVLATEDQTYRAVARGLREVRDVDVAVT
jgi:TP901 family phage tail tape measure protein